MLCPKLKESTAKLCFEINLQTHQTYDDWLKLKTKTEFSKIWLQKHQCWEHVDLFDSFSVLDLLSSILQMKSCFYKMKVVISKSGLYVREPKNVNSSRTRQDMKKSKLGFCRMSSGLSCHVKSLVNTCWPRMWKFGLKLKNSFKNAFFWRCGQNDGAFRQYGFCE